MSDLKYVLQLTIEVPGIYADDLIESARLWADRDPTPKDYLGVVLAEWMRPEVGITVVSIPGDKCMNDDFVVGAHDATIVGASVRALRPSPSTQPPSSESGMEP